jgi:hypothetical protein
MTYLCIFSVFFFYNLGYGKFNNTYKEEAENMATTYQK